MMHKTLCVDLNCTSPPPTIDHGSVQFNSLKYGSEAR